MMSTLEEPINCKGQFILLLIFTTFITLTFSFNGFQYDQNQIEAQALLEFKMSVNLDPNLFLSSWVAGNNVCNWSGITCDHKLQRVVSVVLKFKGLAGSISPYIGNLSFLSTLDLSNNLFSGVIPQELGKLEKLQFLKLQGNTLQGSIPLTLRACTNLLQLRLNNNFLTGAIPTELSSLHNLENLNLSSNNLTSLIPQELANITALKRLDLGSNFLTGPIPSKFGTLAHVRVLDLHSNGLSGYIPKSLSNCTKLRVLWLSSNVLEGPIPSEILTSLTRLEYLSLYSNNLSSSIPEDIGKLWKLRTLSLSHNLLTGGIPMALENCSSLELLSLSSNSLYGNIPAELGSLTQLLYLEVDKNNLAGSIPYSLMNCTELTSMLLTDNKIAGTIPKDIGYKLTKLQQLDLAKNKLTGSLPRSLGNCSALYFLGAAGNQLSGVIPQEFGMLTGLQSLALGQNHFRGDALKFILNCTQLQGLGLEFNGFVGSIPAEIGLKLTNLEEFYIGGNQLSGEIPKSLGNCTQLSVLALSRNQLSGAVPQEFGMLTSLQRLVLFKNKLSSGNCGTLCVLDVLSNCSILSELALSDNYFSGTLSRGVGNLSPRLSQLYLSSNNITGNIPQEIGNLTVLTLLSLSGNNVIGKIPSALSRLNNLHALDLSLNKLQGSIPAEFNKLVNLEYLSLEHNHISGDIPSSIGSLKQLRELDLSYNKLTGRIPNAIGQSFRLEMIDLSYNSLTENIPVEISSLHSLTFFLNFSHNALTGRLPSLGGMQHIQAIDISANKLSGPIPGDIGSCAELQYLNLADNKLEGVLPKSIAQLKSLEEINLSFNKISGPVPESIANLALLRHLNFSYNSLNGSVSNHGAFKNLSETSFLGNPGLCTAEWGRFNLPNCTNSAKIRSHSNGFNKQVFLIACIPSFLALCWILGAVYVFYRKTQRPPFTNSLLRQRGFMQISSDELHRATEGFSPDNLLGTGSFGSVYRGLLSENILVAVKVFDQDPQNSYESFSRECRILRKIKHRNLVKVLSSCTNVDFRALVLEFMSKGSLEKQLHQDKTQTSKLSLQMRLNIALDVAHGMAYLHHDCSPPVVHCDLKPSNVLMDETMTAHVADFGIARLMTSSDSASSSTSRLKGTVGYIAPEYGMGGQVTTKGDVYSFGMLVLEMVTRKRPTDDMFTGNNTLPRWVRRAFPEAVKEVVDRELLVDEMGVAGSSSGTPDGDFDHGRCPVNLIGVGVQCTRQNPGERSTMNEVEGMLEKTVLYGSAEAESSNGEFESTEHGSLIALIGVGLQCTRQNPGERPTMREVEAMLEKTLYGSAYGNLQEHASVPSLVAPRRRDGVGDRNTAATSSTDQSESS